MKLTIVFLTAAFMTVTAAGSSQKISYSGKGVSLEKVFSEIKKQTGYGVLFTDNTLAGTKPVWITADNLPLTDFLNAILKDQPLKFSIESKTVTISRKEEIRPAGERPDDLLPPPVVRGRVVDADGRILPGANITIKGSKKGTIADANGAFSIEAGADDILVISSVGYKTREIRAGAQQGTINVVLEISNSPLDEVQVIGYGTSSRRYNVGAVTTVTSEQIERQPVTNILLALQGQVPGLTISPTGGAPGSAVKVQIRGQNTLARTSNRFAMKPFDQPLFIIDGVPFAAQNSTLGNLFTYDLTSNQQSTIPGNGVSPFGNINPADIESVSVLRDADATSIYGSQGANGVILITTKKGKPGKTDFNITANTGVNLPTRRLEMMNSKQYLAMRRQALTTNNIVITPSNTNNYPDLTVFDTTGRSVDWYEEFFDRRSGFTNVHASLSGGQQNSSFFLSGGYTTNSYNFPGDFSDDRFSLHSSYTYKSTDNKLSVQFGADYSYAKNNASGAPSVTTAMTMSPNYPALLDDNGGLIWRYKGYSLSSFQQYARLRQPARVQSHNLNDYLRVSYQVIPGLSVSGLIGYSRTNSTRYTAVPFIAQDPGSTNRSASATFGSSVFETLNIEPQLDYKRGIGKGELSVLAGGTYKKTLTSSDNLTGSGYTNDDLLGTISGAANKQIFSSGSIYKYTAGFGRIGYVYDRKYIVNLTGRRDGSSNFGPGRQFGNFASAGLGWIFSEESGFHKAIPVVSFGKLSVNYGTAGSDGDGSYLYQANYEINEAYSAFQGVRPYTPYNLYNPDFSWSLKKSWNAALELGFFNDRLVTTINWYQSRISDQLIPYTLPATTGFSSLFDNFPATVQNGGWELSIRSTNIRRQNITWTTNFNISTNKNKLVAFPGLETSPYAQIYVVGKSTSIINGYRFKGVNASTGLFEFYKKDGTLTSSPNSNHILAGGDQQPLFDINPKYTGGMDNTLTYKGFSLSLFLQFAEQKTKTFLAGVYTYSFPGNMANLPAAVAGKWWTRPGDNTEMQKLATSFGSINTAGTAYASSDAGYEDTYYVRVKTVALSWAIPEHFTKKVGIKQCRLNINAQNLFTITNYKLGDPEMNGSIYGFPIQRTITGGISINF